MSRKPHFQDTGKGSFFGDLVYDRIIPKDHFLMALNNLFEWGALSGRLLEAYRGEGTLGRPPYNPVQMFKMLFISYLYGVSERAVEELVKLPPGSEVVHRTGCG
ncbi:MAG: transposase [Chloroflexota bacterium]|nr:transposase [Chloroflexota bacterium]